MTSTRKPRAWHDTENNLWTDAVSEAGQVIDGEVVLVDTQVLARVTVKFGSSPLTEWLASQLTLLVPEGRHQPWCGDASLSRPADHCTCADVPAGSNEGETVPERYAREAKERLAARVGEDLAEEFTSVAASTRPQRR